MFIALIFVLSAFLISAFIVFNLKKQVAVDDQGDGNPSQQSKPKFPFGVLILLFIFAAAFATYMAMPSIMGTH